MVDNSETSQQSFPASLGDDFENAESLDAVDEDEEWDVDEDLDVDYCEYFDGEEELDEDDVDEDEDYVPVETDEEQEELELESEGFLLQVLGNGSAHQAANLRQLMSKYPLLSEHTPPETVGDLADEIHLRLWGSIKNRLSNRLIKKKDVNGIRGSCPARSLLMREMYGSVFSGGGRPDVIPQSSQLPLRPVHCIDQMHSRGYIFKFTADGEAGAAAFQNERKIKIYDTRSNYKVMKDIHARNLQWTITDIAFSSDRKYLLYSSITPTIHVVSIGSADQMQSIANVTDIHEPLHFQTDSGFEAHALWSIRWSQDSSEIIAGSGDYGLWIYDVVAARTKMRLVGHRNDVNAVAYAEPDEPCCPVIFTGSDDNYVKVWDQRLCSSSRNKKPVGVFIGHTQGITHIDPKGDGRYLISNSKDQTIKLWDMRKGMKSSHELSEIEKIATNVPTFRFDYRWMTYPAAGRVVSHPEDASVSTYRGHSVHETLCRAYFSPIWSTAQRYIYAASADGDICIYDILSCKIVNCLQGYHSNCVRDCSWHPFEPSLVSIGFDGQVIEWKPDPCGEEKMDIEEALIWAEKNGEDVVSASKKRQLMRRLQFNSHGDQFHREDFW